MKEVVVVEAMVTIDVLQYMPLVQFLLEANYAILSSPVDGDLMRMLILIGSTTPDFKFTTLETFVEHVVEFDRIFPKVIELEIIEGIDQPKLVWFHYSSLLQLRDRLSGKPFEMVPFHETSAELGRTDVATLIDQLNGPLFTEVQVSYTSDPIVKNMFYSDYNTLESILKTPTAKKTLDRQKAQEITENKLFLEVCKDSHHGRSLANFCLNNRDHLQGISDTISGNHLHKSLETYKNLISPDIFKCAQTKIHFLPITNNHTEVNLGDCSYLDACHKMKSCRYLHYFSLYPNQVSQQVVSKANNPTTEYSFGETFTEYNRQILPAQWINCDVRYILFPILGKFAAIVSDPAWDIHMSLPYGTCKDTELLSLPMHELQDEGIIMLWVTGRSIEVGRQALIKWGYKISDEMIWIKLNQLKRTIVTGRTGHWLNHSKEHLLVGLKGNPVWLTSKVDLDIVVSNTRETSRKPDEIYDIVERMVGKHARKLEVFGRDHNTRPGWLTIGNQLRGTHLVEEELKMKYANYKNNVDNHKSSSH